MIPTVAPGLIVQSSWGNAVAEAVNFLDEERWDDYEPDFAAFVTPVVAMFTTAGSYRVGAEMVDVFGEVDFGGVSDPGSGHYIITLPVTAHADWREVPVGGASLIDDSAGIPYRRDVLIAVDGNHLYMGAQDGTDVAAGTPFNIDVDDVIRFTARYRRA